MIFFIELEIGYIVIDLNYRSIELPIYVDLTDESKVIFNNRKLL